ncbi:hypothetical protein BD779DRAFT_1492961 [Infundibulicybe gibba]|nr:hypothetical protein BD779DRAFT_1492961 [Infundibulicybe gibba]
MPSAPTVRVVVRLPWNRPENPLNDPPTIEWNAEKADILWKVIERSRSSDSGGTDWKGLAAHLEVPLPYLLYRVNARFQEEIRGLKDIQGALSPTKPTVAGRMINGMGGSIRLNTSARSLNPLGVRARLNSLGNGSPRPKKETSSSTLTLQHPAKRPHISLGSTSPTSSSDGSNSEDEELEKEEEADRNAEEQEALDRKLRDLQRMMTSDVLGLVSALPEDRRISRGRMAFASPTAGSYRGDSYSRSASQSVSGASSPQGSIPDIPSPPGGSRPYSPISRHLSPTKSSSPPAISPRSALGLSHRRYGPLVDRSASEQESNHGSEASSFSDLSDASVSESALASAVFSNGGSRLSQFARSRYTTRASGTPH